MKTFISICLIVIVSFLGFFACSGKPTRSDYYTQEDLVSKGWNLIKRWDFYNEIEDFNHTTITEGDSGGVVVVEDGALGFGYAKDGGFLFYESKLIPLPNYSYMIVARVRTNNPYRALLGFYDKTRQSIMGETRITDTDWYVTSSVISFDPSSGERIPVLLFPAFHNLTRYDYTQVDWVELWTFSSAKANSKAD